jgi:hypothetical protein
LTLARRTTKSEERAALFSVIERPIVRYSSKEQLVQEVTDKEMQKYLPPDEKVSSE